MLQSSYTQKYPFNETSEMKTDWENIITKIRESITKDQSPQSLLSTRNHFYELLSRCVPPEIILRSLVVQILVSVDIELKFQVVFFASFYDHRLKTGSKPIFHLEAFVAKIMCLIKEFQINKQTSKQILNIKKN